MKKQLLIFSIATLLLSQSGISQNNMAVQTYHKLKDQYKNENSFQPKALVSRPGKSNNFYWNTSTNAWANVDSSYYTYNSQGDITSQINRNNGIITYKRTYVYNANNQETEILTQEYNYSLSILENTYRFRTEYDINNNETAYYQDLWNSTSNSYELNYGSKSFYTYDSNNKIVEEFRQRYESANPTFVNISKTKYTYNSNTLVEQEEFDWNGTAWIAEYKTIYEYVNNAFTSLIYQEWDGSQYVNYYKMTDLTWQTWNQNWENSDLLSYTSQEWNGTTWVTTERGTYAYDAFGGTVETVEEFVNNNWVLSARYSNLKDSHLNESVSKKENYSNNVWVTEYHSEVVHVYDGNDNITQTTWKNWNTNLFLLENQTRKDYADFQIYNNTVGVENITLNSVLYPNPFNDKCTVLIENEGNYTFSLINSNGQIVKELNFNASLTFYKEELNPGIYFYTISSENIISKTGKLIIE